MAPLTGAQIKTAYAEAMKLYARKDANEALKRLRTLALDCPHVAEPPYQIGRILTEKLLAGAAIPYLERAAEIKPGETAIWMAWSDAVALGAGPEEERSFLDALKKAPIPVKTKLLLQNRFGSSRRSSHPVTGGAALPDLQRMIAMIEAGDAGGAEAMASRLLARHPGSAVAANILATAQAALGKHSAAHGNYLRALKLDPNYAEAHDNMGRLLFDANRKEEAVRHFSRALSLAPGLQSALINFGSALISLGNAGAAVTLLKRALAAQPDLELVHRALGNAHTRLRNYALAETHLLRALELTDAPEARTIALLAQAQSRQGKDDEAAENFERALAIDPDEPTAVVGKAVLLQTLGRFDEAQVLFRRGFELDPLKGDNYRQFMSSYKAKPGDPLIETIKGHYQDERLDDQNRMNMGYALAKAMEDMKEDDEVFRYLDEANALMKKSYSYDIALRLREVHNTKQAMKDVDWLGRKIEGASACAPIFVTGLPRSGTTLVEQIISSHSQVEGGGELGELTKQAQQLIIRKEGLASVKDMPDDVIAALGRNFEEYLAPRFPGAPHVSDKSIQSYMYIGLIKLALPQSRIVVVRRDPRDNLYSMYKNRFPEGTHLYTYDQRDLVTFYGTFLEMLDFWRERVPDWFYEVQYEDLVSNPEEETRKLIAACGLDWEDACLNFHENKRKVETLSVFQVRQPISKASVQGWKRFEKGLKPMLDALREGGYVTD